MEISARQWCLAVCGAAVIHGGIAAAILWKPLRAGADSTDLGGVEVALVAPGEAAAGEIPPIVVTEEIGKIDTPATTADVKPPEHEVVEPPPEVIDTASPAPSHAETVDVTESTELEASVAEAKAVEPTEAEPVEPLRDEVSITEAVEDAPAVNPAQTPSTRPKDPPRIARSEPKPRAATKPQPAAKAASASTRQSVAGAGARVDVDALRRYSADLAAALRARLRYPDEARARRIEGVVTVRFTVDGSGRVLRSSVVRSAGDLSLDRAALATVSVGTSLPAPPPSHKGSLTFSAPLRFQLR